MKATRVTQRIKKAAFDVLKDHPNGLSYSALKREVQRIDAAFNSNTINGCIWNLDAVFPDKIYKPSKGIFRLLTFKSKESDAMAQAISLQTQIKIKKSDFYIPFADWLKRDMEDVTHAIPLGGNIF
jgi:hypothetical protein